MKPKFRVLGVSVLGLSLLAMHLATRRSLALKPVLDQAADMGYSDGLTKELSRLFPDARKAYALQQAEKDRSPLTDQVLTDYDRDKLEQRLHERIMAKVKASGMVVDTLSVAYLGRMNVKVLLTILTHDLPYAEIREMLTRMRSIVEREVLPESFEGFRLAQLSTFTVKNKRNGKVYEYPVLYHNIELPWFTGENADGVKPPPPPEHTGHKGPAREPGSRTKKTDQTPASPASPEPQASPSPRAEENHSARPIKKEPASSSYLGDDFLGSVIVHDDPGPEGEPE